MDLRLLNVDELPWPRRMYRNHNRKRLGDADTHIRDGYDVLDASASGTREPADPQFHTTVTHVPCLHGPSQPKPLQIGLECRERTVLPGLPIGYNARHVVLEKPREVATNRPDRIGRLRVAPEARQMDNTFNNKVDLLWRYQPETESV